MKKINEIISTFKALHEKEAIFHLGDTNIFVNFRINILRFFSHTGI